MRSILRVEAMKTWRRGLLAPYVLALLLAIASSSGLAQSPFNLNNQVATAFRVDTPPVLDGRLDDAVWRQGASAGNFTQSRPTPNSRPTWATEFWVAYDDQFLYVAAQMHDTAPDSILQQMSVRDNVENSDEFGFWFSPYNDGINAIGFTTTPRGLMADFLMNSGGDDSAWNGVWEVESRIHEGGWSTEIRIPWSQFRMPTL
ncbi:MAG: carbohydrate binding family 9 domain-containing protein, partial [Flavobacteriales bacterium]